MTHFTEGSGEGGWGAARADLRSTDPAWVIERLVGSAQQLHRLGVGAPVKRRETLDHRNADGAIETGCLDGAGGRLAHCLEPPLDRRLPARPQLGHRSVNVGEDEAFPVGMVLPQIRLLRPAVAGVATERVEAPQEWVALVRLRATGRCVARIGPS